MSSDTYAHIARYPLDDTNTSYFAKKAEESVLAGAGRKIVDVHRQTPGGWLITRVTIKHRPVDDEKLQGAYARPMGEAVATVEFGVVHERETTLSKFDPRELQTIEIIPTACGELWNRVAFWRRWSRP